MITLNVNGRSQEIDADPEMPLLWALRDLLKLTGTKYGCGVAACGACTVHIDGQPIRSCQTPVSAAVGAKITTIEGLSTKGEHAVQRAWVELDVVQCGYCQSGQIMAATALLETTPDPTDDDIDGECARRTGATLHANIADRPIGNDVVLVEERLPRR